MMRFNAKLNSRGNAFVDYLMMTAVVAGIMVPIVNRFFGQAIMDSLFANRQRLVDFIAQTPKRPVPNLWFSSEKQGEVGGNGDVGGNGNLGEVGDVGGGGALGEVGDVGGGGNLNNPRAVGGNGKLGNVGNVGGGGSLGEVGGGRGGTGGSGGGGGGLGGSDEMNPDFFNAQNKGGGGAEDDSGGGGNSKRTYGRGSSGDGESSSGGGGRAENLSNKTAKNSNERDSDKVDGGSETRKAQNQMIAQVEENEREKARAFDWWLILKILIVLLILFLLILIALSNLKRT